jgi:hypothetical protein
MTAMTVYTIHTLAVAAISEAALASATVDLILTAPPGDYDALARLAMRVLRPSGWCVILIDDAGYRRVHATMHSPDLPYRGYTAIADGDGHKLVMTFQKPPAAPPPHPGAAIDVSRNGHDRSRHPWRQSIEALIVRYSYEGGLVVDPFAGSGEILRVALARRRRVWGADATAPSRPR